MPPRLAIMIQTNRSRAAPGAAPDQTSGVGQRCSHRRALDLIRAILPCFLSGWHCACAGGRRNLSCNTLRGSKSGPRGGLLRSLCLIIQSSCRRLDLNFVCHAIRTQPGTRGWSQEGKADDLCARELQKQKPPRRSQRRYFLLQECELHLTARTQIDLPKTNKPACRRRASQVGCGGRI